MVGARNVRRVDSANRERIRLWIGVVRQKYLALDCGDSNEISGVNAFTILFRYWATNSSSLSEEINAWTKGSESTEDGK